jgi:hypothetical protein
VQKGNVIRVLYSLKYFITIKDKQPKIEELVKNTYISQLTQELKNKSLNKDIIELAFNRYIEIFGTDLEIKETVKLFQNNGYNIRLPKNIENNFSWWNTILPTNLFTNKKIDNLLYLL